MCSIKTERKGRECPSVDAGGRGTCSDLRQNGQGRLRGDIYTDLKEAEEQTVCISKGKARGDSTVRGPELELPWQGQGQGHREERRSQREQVVGSWRTLCMFLAFIQNEMRSDQMQVLSRGETE